MDKVIELIKNAKSAVILPHINADADAVASCQAMRCALSYLNIPSVIYAEETIEKRLDFISEGVIIYDGKTVDFDTCIVLDCGDTERTGKRCELLEKAGTVINIDHHQTNKGFGDASLVVGDASATGEVLFDVFSRMEIPLTCELARYLYTAICSDTGGFAFSNVSPKTFRVAAELIGCDIDHAEISRLLFNCVDMDEELLKAELLNTVRSYSDGKIRTVTLTKSLAERFGIEIGQIDGIVDIPRRIRGTEVAVAIKEGNKGIRVSLRSNGDVDVSSIALAIGGGGHKKAAGCTVYGASCDEAEKIVVCALQEVVK